MITDFSDYLKESATFRHKTVVNLVLDQKKSEIGEDFPLDRQTIR